MQERIEVEVLKDITTAIVRVGKLKRLQIKLNFTFLVHILGPGKGVDLLLQHYPYRIQPGQDRAVEGH